jgi:hypothetical protein
MYIQGRHRLSNIYIHLKTFWIQHSTEKKKKKRIAKKENRGLNRQLINVEEYQ